MKKITDFQVDDLGMENSQYFQGYGIAFSKFHNCMVGVGDNPLGALEDCLEQIATSNEEEIDFDDFEKRIYGQYPDFKNEELNQQNSVFAKYDDDCEDIYYYIGIKWNI